MNRGSVLARTSAGGGWRRPLLTDAVLYVDASRNGDDPGIVDLAGDNDLTAPSAEPKIIGPSSWTGQALVGYMLLTGGWDAALAWPADNHTRFTAVVLPHHATSSPSAKYSEVANINTGDADRDYYEPSFVLEDDGSIYPAQDMDSAGAGDPLAFVHATSVGTWAAGVAEDDYDIIIDADDGAGGYTGTVKKNGVTVGAVFTGAGTLTLPEPPDEQPVQVGPFQHATLVKSWELLDAIDGDPLVAFDAADPTGWTAADGRPSGPPAESAWLGGFGSGWAVDDPTLDIAADGSATWAIRLRPLASGGSFVSRNSAGFLGGAGWGLVNAPGFGLDYQFRITDGTETVTKTLGTIDPDADQLVVVQLDRGTDLLRAYIDGVQVTTGADASALGAVSPDATVDLWVEPCFGYQFGYWDEIIAPADIAVALGV